MRAIGGVASDLVDGSFQNRRTPGFDLDPLYRISPFDYASSPGIGHRDSPADTDGSGVVDGGDLLGFLEAYGTF